MNDISTKLKKLPF